MRQKPSRGGGQKRLIRRLYEETESLSMLGAKKDKERGDRRTNQQLKNRVRISSSNLVYIQRDSRNVCPGRPCFFRTIENCLRDWGFNRRNLREDSTELRLRFAVLFQLSYSDTNIVRQLVREGQGQISERQVARIQRRIGFVRRMTV